MHSLRLDDTDWLEAVSQDEFARQIYLRMAALAQSGRTPSFVAEVARDRELDRETKVQLVELAQNEAFLLAVEEYLVTHTGSAERGREEMGDPGFEPGTSALSERRSNQLS